MKRRQRSWAARATIFACLAFFLIILIGIPVVAYAGSTAAQGSIQASVFKDVADDGVWNSGDAPLISSPIGFRLLREGAFVAEKETQDGIAAFDNLPFGTYVIQEQVPDGWICASGTEQTATLDANACLAFPVFGNVQDADLEPAADKVNIQVMGVSGTKWLDVNGDGIHSADEPGLAGITIELWRDEIRLAQTTSSAEGSFSFDAPELGTYVVKEAGQPGFIPTSPSSQTVTLDEMNPRAYVEFLNTRLGSIRGTVWLDANSNGVLDETDAGTANVSLELLEASSKTRAMAVTATADSGNYEFSNLKPGTYIVRERIADNVRPVWPAEVTVVVNGGDRLTIDFMNGPTETAKENTGNDQGAAPAAPSTEETLPATGANLKWPMILALALVLIGAVAIGIGVWTRRSRQN